MSRADIELLSVAAIIGVALIVYFVATVVIYAVNNGVHGYAVGGLAPPRQASWPRRQSCYSRPSSALRRPTGRPREMRNPRSDVPIEMFTGGTLVVIASVALLGDARTRKKQPGSESEQRFPAPIS